MLVLSTSLKGMELKMKRFAIICVLGAIIGASAWSTPGGISVTIDGKKLSFSGQQPLMRGGRVLVPMRGIFEALGAQVQWTPKTKLIVATKGNETVELRIGQKTASKNGSEVEIDTPPIVLKRSTMVPLRFVAETLRADVGWDEASQTVVITTGGDGRPRH
jgi:spore coat protein H